MPMDFFLMSLRDALCFFSKLLDDLIALLFANSCSASRFKCRPISISFSSAESANSILPSRLLATFNTLSIRLLRAGFINSKFNNISSSIKLCSPHALNNRIVLQKKYMQFKYKRDIISDLIKGYLRVVTKIKYYHPLIGLGFVCIIIIVGAISASFARSQIL